MAVFFGWLVKLLFSQYSCICDLMCPIVGLLLFFIEVLVMTRSVDTLYRQWLMLSRVPRYPRKVSVPELKDMLLGEGYDVDTRTIQRDLIKLSSSFPLNNETEGRKNYWFWIEYAVIQDLPGMEPVTALAFEMAESYLKPLLPEATLNLMLPYFNRAKEVLGEQSMSALKTWPKKVAVIEKGPVLHKPVIKPELQQVIYQALLNETAINASYQTRGSDTAKDYLMHPLGIVSRMGVLYLVCTLWDYQDIKQFALHRFITAEPSDEPYRENTGFNLNDYTKEQHQFSYPTTKELVKLKALFEKNIAWHLAETPLSDDQILIPQNDERVLLEATVTETLELKWWLLSFGDNVEVVEPIQLREKFKSVAKRLSHIYS